MGFIRRGLIEGVYFSTLPKTGFIGGRGTNGERGLIRGNTVFEKMKECQGQGQGHANFKPKEYGLFIKRLSAAQHLKP